MTTMMALRAHQRGGPEQLVYESAPVPVPGPGEALVAVHAAGITFDELTWDLSWTTQDGEDRTPVIPGHEVSGVIDALGPDVTGLSVGDEVFALIEFDRNGAAADYVIVPAAHLAARPATASHTEAATLPLAALTAWQALVDHAHVEAADQVLVLGGAGGVGVYAVQLAAALDGHVTATGRERQGDFICSLGAHAFAAAGTELSGSFDVIIDTVGGAALDASYDLLAPGGRLVTLGSQPSEEKAAARGAHATFFIVTPDAGELAKLAGLVDEGRLRVIVSQTFPVSDGRRAFESAHELRPPGKTVLTVR
jgi:NADPH:quinone reductase-like Zn-dependent oxidoreductase